MRKNLGVLLILFVMACASSKKAPEEVTEPVSFWINEEPVDGQEGLRMSMVRTFPQPYLGITVHDTTLAQQLAQNDALQIVLARASRPIASSWEPYDVPYRMGFDVTILLEHAKPGDRLMFTSSEGNRIFYILSIVQ